MRQDKGSEMDHGHGTGGIMTLIIRTQAIDWRVLAVQGMATFARVVTRGMFFASLRNDNHSEGGPGQQ